jgi:hypothetical protein
MYMGDEVNLGELWPNHCKLGSSEGSGVVPMKGVSGSADDYSEIKGALLSLNKEKIPGFPDLLDIDYQASFL